MNQTCNPRRPGMRARLSMIMVALVALLAPPVIIRAQQQPAKPQIKPEEAAAALAAHDSHQGLLVAVDPYLTSERSQETFGKKHPYGAGLLALDVYLRNDSEAPMRITLETVELSVAPPGQSHQRIEPLSAEDAAFRIVLPDGPPQPKQRRGPIPGMSGSSKKSKEVAKMEDSLRGQMLPGDVVGPHSTVHGFVFFDVDGHFGWVKDSTLVVPDVARIGTGEKLLFFEVDLAPATR